MLLIKLGNIYYAVSEHNGIIVYKMKLPGLQEIIFRAFLNYSVCIYIYIHIYTQFKSRNLYKKLPFFISKYLAL